MTPYLFLRVTVVLIIIVILVHSGIRTKASLVLGAAISMIMLIIIKPPAEINPWVESEAILGIYSLIMIGTPIIVVAYSLISAFQDRKV